MTPPPQMDSTCWRTRWLTRSSSKASREARPQRKLAVSEPGNSLELEADRAADKMIAGQPASVAAAAPAVQREIDEGGQEGDTGAGDPDQEGLEEGLSATDLLSLYFARGGFEQTLSEEDREQEPDRWCSGHPLGQEAWQLLSQGVWNLRLRLGYAALTPPLRRTLWAPAEPTQEPTPPPCEDPTPAPEPVVSMGEMPGTLDAPERGRWRSLRSRPWSRRHSSQHQRSPPQHQRSPPQRQRSPPPAGTPRCSAVLSPRRGRPLGLWTLRCWGLQARRCPLAPPLHRLYPHLFLADQTAHPLRLPRAALQASLGVVSPRPQVGAPGASAAPTSPGLRASFSAPQVKVSLGCGVAAFVSFIRRARTPLASARAR